MRDDEVEFADGSHGRHCVVDRPDFAVVIPEERGGFHLVEQFRYSIGRRSWEFPSGAFPPGVTGTVEEMAAAELAEETGYTAATWRPLGYQHGAIGTSGQGFHVFHATDLTPGPPRREVSEQGMRTQWFSREEFEQLLRAGTITAAQTTAAYLLLQLHA